MMRQVTSISLVHYTALLAFFVGLTTNTAQANPEFWAFEWPVTNFDKSSIDYSEVKSGGPPKDGIPPIDNPQFVPFMDIKNLDPLEPVIGLQVGDALRAYPLNILMWHEIVNDEIGGLPVAATFCPLCNAVMVFDRRVTVDNETLVLDFGTTGKLRKSDLIMWDRQTESWWQQFTGEAIVGDMLGARLSLFPSRLESWERFQPR